ncbi:hypothetical protein [Bifidobacterium olomucense]|uniref:Uncharacterized protein n=1 Tax=Bifidobacterium olomucense TaxID=2675324 RepID=A0A7Y0HWS0_9BIFI|nr:hypothetical protein [Bifidobacterium sp. DSM 109959]NMM97577.1 hypothetical protein [Bifidobacterium sp. DSM 109959]
MSVGSGSSESLVDSYLREVGWVRCPSDPGAAGRVDALMRVLASSGHGELAMRVFDLVALRPVVAGWFLESMGLLATDGYDDADVERRAALEGVVRSSLDRCLREAGLIVGEDGGSDE